MTHSRPLFHGIIQTDFTEEQRMKIDRLIGILSILLQKETITAPVLAEQFEVSRRTISRDIDTLCQAGIPIVTRQGINGGISIMDGYTIDRTLLTGSEMKDIDYSRKDDFCWISMIRLPEFVTREVFDWAVREATEKKKTDFSKAEFFTLHEGLCVQCMHTGSYDDEPETIQKIDAFLEEQGYETDFSGCRIHHEIYLSDPRRTAPEKLRTVIRLPIRRK